jgi:hypothetical protein
MLNESAELQNLKQVVEHENTDFFGFVAVLIVEGQSEIDAKTNIGDSLTINLAERGIKLISMEGQRKHY